MAVANLNIIRRQRDPELRKAVEAAPERPREAFERRFSLCWLHTGHVESHVDGSAL